MILPTRENLVLINAGAALIPAIGGVNTLP
jgi:hypothetical protein